MIKKWFPFFLLVFVIVISSLYLLFSSRPSDYEPRTDDPLQIYREACAHCHGDEGQGTGLLYPAFKTNLEKEEINKAITEGSFLMPAFPNIKGDTLQVLIRFIENEAYKTSQ
jgi:mono/diheme cytochrome c family protein